MEPKPITQEALFEALKATLTEAYLGPPNPKGTWFVDNEADCGFVGMLDRVDAAQASKPQGYPEKGSIAAHAYHIRFALDLTLRAARGEPAHENAKWSTSWLKTTATEQEWKTLRAELRSMVAELLSTLKPGDQWSDPDVLTGSIGLVAHGAWHLGAIRQLIAQV